MISKILVLQQKKKEYLIEYIVSLDFEACIPYSHAYSFFAQYIKKLFLHLDYKCSPLARGRTSLNDSIGKIINEIANG